MIASAIGVVGFAAAATTTIPLGLSAPVAFLSLALLGGPSLLILLIVSAIGMVVARQLVATEAAEPGDDRLRRTRLLGILVLVPSIVAMLWVLLAWLLSSAYGCTSECTAGAVLFPAALGISAVSLAGAVYLVSRVTTLLRSKPVVASSTAVITQSDAVLAPTSETATNIAELDQSLGLNLVMLFAAIIAIVALSLPWQTVAYPPLPGYPGSGFTDTSDAVALGWGKIAAIVEWFVLAPLVLLTMFQTFVGRRARVLGAAYLFVGCGLVELALATAFLLSPSSFLEIPSDQFQPSSVERGYGSLLALVSSCVLLGTAIIGMQRERRRAVRHRAKVLGA